MLVVKSKKLLVAYNTFAHFWAMANSGMSPVANINGQANSGTYIKQHASRNPQPATTL